MKFIYFGSSYFSRLVLEKIYSKGFIPSLIVSQPDKPKRRGLNILPTEVSLFAVEKNISIIKPLSLRNEEIKKKLEDEEVDLFIVADYGKILPSDLLSIPKIMPLGLHPSLLPFYRGPAPINWAIINGEEQTGVTIFKINEKVDSGEIILQKKINITDNDDIYSLTNKLANEGSNALIEAINNIEEGNYTLTPQDEKSVSFSPSFEKKDGRINWETNAECIRNLIRGTLGWPSAYTFYKDKLIKILEADVIKEEYNDKPSTIVKIDKEGIYVATDNSILKIKRIKPQGRREMSAYSFVCGYRVKVKEKLSYSQIAIEEIKTM